MAVESPPIIIKKIKKGGHGHHGGAWKVAFADFVTAMMAFFMLMWLMGSTTPEQKAAISDYMNDPLSTTSKGGAGGNPILEGGDGILDGKGPAPLPQAAPGEAEAETPGTGAPSAESAAEIAAQAEHARMEELMEELKAAVEASDTLKPFKDQLLLDITSEGLRIQIVDKENRAMFAQGSPVLENYMRELLREVVKVINQVPNRISISGHTDQTPFASSNGYSNWELSSDRANAARRELVAGGVAENKIGRVVGLASSVLFNKQDPYGPINRRISIIVMNKATDDAVNEGEGRPALAQVSDESPPPEDLSAPISASDLGLPIITEEPELGVEVLSEQVAPVDPTRIPPPEVVPANAPPINSDSEASPPAPTAPPAPAPPKPKKIVKIATR